MGRQISWLGRPQTLLSALTEPGERQGQVPTAVVNDNREAYLS